MMNNELQHHGILGMHWGVRRYQPYRTGERVKGGREVGQATKVIQRTLKPPKPLTDGYGTTKPGKLSPKKPSGINPRTPSINDKLSMDSSIKKGEKIAKILKDKKIEKQKVDHQKAKKKQIREEWKQDIKKANEFRDKRKKRA